MPDEEKKAIEHLEKMKQNKNIMFMNWVDGEILLNLIEKQSKEIEELNLKNEKLYEDNLTLAQEIEKLKEEYNTKLLSNAGIYQLGFKDGTKSVENKIKAKIEDLKKNSNGDDFNLTNVIMLFKSLLEKE